VLKNGFLAQIKLFCPILAFAPAVVHDPPAVAACTGVVTPRIKKAATARTEILVFTIFLLG
jgi:hypothetical protein